MKPYLRRFNGIFLCACLWKMKEELLEGIVCVLSSFFSYRPYLIKQDTLYSWIIKCSSSNRKLLSCGPEVHWQGNQQQKVRKECNRIFGE
jgi:hypothetical protein